MSSRGFKGRLRALDAQLAVHTALVEEEGTALEAHLRTMDGRGLRPTARLAAPRLAAADVKPLPPVRPRGTRLRHDVARAVVCSADLLPGAGREPGPLSEPRAGVTCNCMRRRISGLQY